MLPVDSSVNVHSPAFEAPADEQAAALARLEASPASFLSGRAGTGKTTVARELAKKAGTVLAATTGIAAINLGEGTTINSLLGYFDTDSLLEIYTNGRLQSRLRHLRGAGLRRIVLDEVSMLDERQLTAITRALDDVNEIGGTLEDVAGDGEDTIADAGQSAGAGGLSAGRAGDEPGDEPPQIALTLVGDFAQLPPVKSEFAFTSPLWGRYEQSTVQLSQVRRQEVREFAEALQAVRIGDAATALRFFTGDRFAQSLDLTFNGTTIFAKNDAVDRFNQLRMDEIREPEWMVRSTRWGKQRGDWKQIPESLTLKNGALVMVLANRREELPPDVAGPARLVYANGDLGTVVAPEDGGRARVLLMRRDNQKRRIEVVVEPVTRQLTVPLEPGRRKVLHDTGQDRLIFGKYEIVGEITYLPLRVAYGTTVHKSQSLSLDEVQVNIRDGFFLQPSMLYVALSRARTAEGLRIVGGPQSFLSRCRVNPAVRRWL
jgi:ATP-dependent exoDNAse (exonuclease V) alpha subunit